MSLIPPRQLQSRLFPIPRASFLRATLRIQSEYSKQLTIFRSHNKFPPTNGHFSQLRLISSTSLGSSNGLPHQQPLWTGQYSPDPVPLAHPFYKIIQEGQPDQIMNAFLDPRNAHLIGSISQSTFVEAFQLLSPTYFIIPYREIHRRLHPSAAKIKGHKDVEVIFDQFATNIISIIKTRQSAGNALCLAEYKHLLDCARAMGNGPMADNVWEGLLNDPTVRPDLQCYNYYMEALVWDRAHTGKERYRLRIDQFAYWKRSKYTEGWQGYGVKGRSVRVKVMCLFKDMTSTGIAGDEATFVNVFLAFTRVGYVKGAKSILKSVWNVDVDALCSNDPDVSPAKRFDRSSPLYPTDRLLFAVAHGFGVLSNIPAALQTVEFISRSYNISVPEYVWVELFERAFVISRPNAHYHDEWVIRNGQVPRRFLFEMTTAMASRPYDCPPTIDMCRMLVKASWSQRSLFDAQHFTRIAYDRLVEMRRKRKEARLILERYLSELTLPGGGVDTLGLQSRGFADAIKTYEILRIRTAQYTSVVERLARLLLAFQKWVIDKNDPAWERWHLPRILEEWQDFLPQTFDHPTTGGIVKFVGKSSWAQQYLTTHKTIPRRRSSLSTEPGFEEEPPELDDDFFWGNYIQTSPLAKVDHFLLNRVFWEVGPGTNYVESEDEIVHRRYIPPKHATEDQALDLLLNSPVIPLRTPRRRWRPPAPEPANSPVY